MDRAVREKLRTLGALDSGNTRRPDARCKVCGARAPFFDAVDFNKYCEPTNFYSLGYADVEVSYYRCIECEYTFTPFFEDWSTADFSEFVYNADYIKVDGDYAVERPLSHANTFSTAFASLKSAAFLDYGGGSGKYAEEMRQRGFERTYCYDPFSQPRRPEGAFEVVTAIEVVEHSPEPMQIFEDMKSFMRPGGCILFSQALHPPNIMSLRANWWYIAPRNGHVSTYSLTTLTRIADRLGLQLYRCHEFLYALADDEPGAVASAALNALGAFRENSVVLRPSRADPAAWHGIEVLHGQQFRWSAKEEIVWQYQVLLKGVNQISIPVLMEARADLAAKSRLSVNGQEIDTHFANEALRGVYLCETSAVVRISLTTPPLVGPEAERENSDTRRLGLAVLET